MTEFKSVNFDEWQNHAISDLKSAQEFDKLFRKWGDLKVKPYFDSADISDKILTFSNHLTPGDASGVTPRRWYNVVSVDVNDAAAANAEVLSLLMKGVEGIHFNINKPVSIRILLQDILPQYIFLSFTVAEMSQADEIRAWLDSCDLDRKDVTGYIQFKNSDENDDHLISLFEPWPNFCCLFFGQAESSDDDVQSLAEMMVGVNNLLDRYTRLDHSPEAVSGNLVFGITLGPVYFHEIVRLRAIRLLIYKLTRAWGVNIPPEDFLIHAISSPWVNEDFQPMGNLIKSASTAMAGVLGGCNALTVMPEDPKSPLQNRIARNTGIILKEESYLDRTRDTIAGAYYIEALTEELARSVWTEFQKLTAQ